MTPAAASSTRSWRPLGRRLAFALAATLLGLWHLALALHAERYALRFGTESPLAWVDFDTHAEQVWRALEAMERFGATWAYDVQLLAGYPNGAVFEADDKGWELFAYVLHRGGLSKVVAFNLFVALAHLLVVPVVYAAARLFDLSRWEALAAAALGSMLWFFDGLTRWSWFSGAVAFGIASVWCLLPVGLLYRYLERGSWRLLGPLALALAVGHVIHPSFFLMVVVPMVALYARAFRGLGWRRHLALVGVGLFVIGANAYWIVPALRFAHYATGHEPFFVAGLSFVLTDLLGLIQDLSTSGVIGNRTGFRLLAIGACTLVCIAWRRRRDRRLLPLGAAVGFPVALAYLGGYLGPLREIQPHRSIVPAAFFACLGATAFFGEVGRAASTVRLPSIGRAAACLGGLLGSLYLVHDALYFLPTLLPKLGPLPTGEPVQITSMGFIGHQDYRHKPVTTDITKLAAWVKEHDDGRGRFLVEWWWLGEHLLWRTNAQVLGGFRQRNLDHTAANLFRASPDGDLADDELRRYFETYAVRWVILSLPKPRLEERRALLEPVATIGFHRIYRTLVPVSFFQEGSGELAASMNRLAVTGSDPDRDVVLRFHWLETLVCRPACQLRREPVAGNPVGFLRVPAPHPTDFAVENGY